VWTAGDDGGWWVTAIENAETHGGLAVAGTLRTATLDLGRDVPLCVDTDEGVCAPNGNTISARASLVALAKPSMRWQRFWSHGSMFSTMASFEVLRPTPASGMLTVNGVTMAARPETAFIDRIVNHSHDPADFSPPAALVMRLTEARLAAMARATTHDRGWLSSRWMNASGEFGTLQVMIQESSEPGARMYAACFGPPNMDPVCVFPPEPTGVMTLTVADELSHSDSAVTFGEGLIVTTRSSASGVLRQQTAFMRIGQKNGPTTTTELYRSVDSARQQAATVTVNGTPYPSSAAEAGAGTGTWTARTVAH
jgi:hypothetical protein